MKSERAEVMATARVRLKDYFLTPDDKFDEALFERRVFIVDARIALRAQLDGEKGDAPESTGLPAFARAMQQMMEDGEYLSIKLDAAIVETLIPALNEAGRNIANKRQHLTSDKRGRDTAQVTSEMSRLEAIEARLSELFDQISYEVYGRVLTAEEHRQISRKRIAEMLRTGFPQLWQMPTISRHLLNSRKCSTWTQIAEEVVCAAIERGSLWIGGVRSRAGSRKSTKFESRFSSDCSSGDDAV